MHSFSSVPQEACYTVTHEPTTADSAAAAAAVVVVSMQELGKMSRPQMILALRKSADVEVRVL
jgi:hypothetical protein